MRTVLDWSSTGAPEMTLAARTSSGPRSSGNEGMGEYALYPARCQQLVAVREDRVRWGCYPVAESMGVCDAAQGTEAPALVNSLGSASAEGAAVVRRGATSVVLSVLVVLCRIATMGARTIGRRAARRNLEDVVRKSDMIPVRSSCRCCCGGVERLWQRRGFNERFGEFKLPCGWRLSGSSRKRRMWLVSSD